LKTARAAERAALETLRASVAALPVDPAGTTVGAAFPDRVERALTASRVSGVTYRADGSVQLRVTLPARVVWQELERSGSSR
jgi:hypothetical protein